MKVLLTAVNAKYIHTNLAVRYLLNTIKDFCDAKINEYSINDNIFLTERSIMLEKPDIICFSCYIWNVDIVLKICADIKKALPNVYIILGGPEVSFDSHDISSKNPSIDYIISGEGEISFPALIRYIMFGEKLTDGVYFEDFKTIKTEPDFLPGFSVIDVPYKGDIVSLNGRIVYYESSRGCPYNCKYCLSGEHTKVRFKDTESVKNDLEFFSENNIPLVKFVDRTFNADKKRAKEIWKYISEMETKTRFHMEITGEILDDESISILKKINGDKLQFEIGVQSTNLQTMHAIDRVCDMDKLFMYIKRLVDETDIHIHLDLIVGLPYEDMTSFKKSFNDVISLKPHVLQIGFLKLLKGSAMRNETEKYGIIYRDYAPYEIISNDYMSYDEILYLKDFDYVFDKYYNSGNFSKTMDFLFDIYDDRYQLFEYIVDYYRKNNYIGSSFSKENIYHILYDCFKTLGSGFCDSLKYDYIYNMHPGKLPSWFFSDLDLMRSEKVFSFLKNESIKKKILPQYYGIPAKVIIKHVHFERFSFGVLMFDYKYSIVYDVTQYI